jgi:molybdenum cofactor cytidylyltransferase
VSVAAIVLAAGQGTRFGPEPKLLATLAGKPLVRHVADAALASRACPVIAVLGHRSEEIGAALPASVRRADNPDYAAGLATSLKAGFAALPSSAEAAIVLLGDMPGATAGLIDALIDAWTAAGRPAAAIPTCEGRRGNPVLLSAALAPEIRTLSGDAGAAALLRARTDVLEVPVLATAVLADVDTRDALAALRDRAAASAP